MKRRAAITLAILFCVGCRAAPPQRGHSKMIGSKSDLAFTARLSVTATSLDIAYMISNHGREAVYLLDTAVLIDSHGGTTVGPARPRVEYSGESLVTLSDKLFPLPRGMAMSVPPSAYGERLAAGATKSGVVSFGLPLRDNSVAYSNQTREVACHRVRFVVGAIQDAPELQAQEQVIQGVPLWRLEPAAWGLQHEMAAEGDVSPEVRVLVKE